MRRILLLRNSRASRGDAGIEDALCCIRDLGIDVDERQPEDACHMRFLIRAEARSVDAVVVGGGDGTINAALKPVLEAGLPLGVLPLGTANDFARTLGIPDDPAEACAIIAGQQTRTIDVGWANDRPFVNAAGIGLSTRVAQHLSAEGKKRLGPLSYPVAVLDTMRTQRPFRASVRGNGRVRMLKSIQITVGNGVFYGGGTPLSEDAAIDDGVLDLFSVRPQPTMSRLLRVAVAVYRGTQAHLEQGVDVMAGDAFEIATSRPQRVSLDGEPALETPVRFRIGRHALTVFAPAEPA